MKQWVTLIEIDTAPDIQENKFINIINKIKEFNSRATSVTKACSYNNSSSFSNAELNHVPFHFSISLALMVFFVPDWVVNI